MTYAFITLGAMAAVPLYLWLRGLWYVAHGRCPRCGLRHERRAGRPYGIGR